MLSRGKARMTSVAVKIFTDREEPQASFQRALAMLEDGTSPFHVLMYYGVGGIGKTSLLRHLLKKPTEKGLLTVFVNLEASAFSSVPDVLLEIRRALLGEYPLFEYALVRHLARQGRKVDEIVKKGIPGDSLLFDLIELGSSVAEVVAPARLLWRLFEKGHERIRRLLPTLKTEFEKIDLLDDEVLEGMLPAYLGNELGEYLRRSGTQLVMFLDSHEASAWRSAYRNTKQMDDDWLTEFIGAAEIGLYVIAGRERLKWEDRESEWGSYLEQHILGSLSDCDADDFLQGIPVIEADVRAAIIESASGVPLYLDLCAETYLLRKAAGAQVSAGDFRGHSEEVITRFLAHLDPNWASALRVMAILQLFDRDLFVDICRKFNINISLMQFENFCGSSYISEIQRGKGLYKAHDIVRDYILNNIEEQFPSQHLVSCLLAQLQVSDLHGDITRAAWIFAELCAAGQRFDLALTSEEWRMLLQSGITIIDGGRWLDIDRSVPSLQDAAVHERYVSIKEAVIAYMRAYCARKEGRLKDARGFYETATKHVGEFAEMAPLLRYHSAHVTHLLGDFSGAMSEYNVVSRQNGASEAERLARFLAIRQIADVEMIRGKFQTALARFQSMRDAYDDPLWQAEVARFQGHAWRFNAQFSKAQAEYERAEKLAQECAADAMLGKACTNLAEALCWKRPGVALEFAERAIELNRAVQAPIEIGKAFAAKSLGLSFLGRYEEALEAAAEAENIQDRSGYVNGTLYAMQAQGVAHHFMGESEIVKRLCTQMRDVSNRVGVYGFLRLPLLLTIDETTARSEYQEYEWIDRELTIEKFRSLLLRADSHGAPD